jgi:hypothetical protein
VFAHLDRLAEQRVALEERVEVGALLGIDQVRAERPALGVERSVQRAPVEPPDARGRSQKSSSRRIGQ